MKLEIGEFYLSSKGEIAKIHGKYGDKFLDSNFNSYKESGQYFSGPFPLSKHSKYDLITHIPKELHYKIIKVINEYHIGKNQ